MSSAAKPGSNLPQKETFLGHPTGLFQLFFAEMWERFSFYGMRALLVFYMTKEFLKYADSEAYTVYGAYMSLVYMTPFFGGMIADRLLGSRRAVVLGGLLMAAGHVIMMVPTAWGFFVALALLIAGNGMFKPNISTIVGTLYPEGSKRRDGGFTIFYMGINFGAAMSPLLCGYIGETLGYHKGFGLASVGMLSGLAVFVAPNAISRLMIALSAISSAAGLFIFYSNNPLAIGVNIFTGVALLGAAITSISAISRGSLPREAGAPRDLQKLRRTVGGIPASWWVYLGALASIPVFVLLVSGFSMFTPDGKSLRLIPESVTKSLRETKSPVNEILATVLHEASTPAGLVLVISGVLAFGFLILETFRLHKIERERMYVVLILTFFSMLFWSFFEQAGSSLTNFTDRNIDRVLERRVITADEVGKTIRIQPTQEQLGYHNGDSLFTLTTLTDLRKANESKVDEKTKKQVGDPNFEIDWVVAEGNVGMGIAQRNDELPASWFQCVNPLLIIIFGLVFSVLWAKLAARNAEPSTPFKFALGLLQLGFGFGAFWYGAMHAHNGRGMVSLNWLLLGYLLQTTGELCLSPVGLSMVTKLSPRNLVSTVMGVWFLATAFSQFLAAIISQFTSVPTEGKVQVIPAPIETYDLYGRVFGPIAIAAIVSSGICFLLVPLLKYWMHEEKVVPAMSDVADYNPPAEGRH